MGAAVTRQGVFGDRRTSAVAMVEPPVSRSYARKARVAFFAVAVPVGAVVAVSWWVDSPAILGLLVGLLAGGAAGLAAAVVVRVWPVLRVLWHWTGEIAVVVLFAWLLALLGEVPAGALLVVALALLAVVGAVVAMPPVRRRAVRLARRTWRVAVAWVWCAVVRHRLRLCFADFIRAASRLHPGSLPLILLARPTPAGERVWVWLRPGLDLSDLDGRTGKMAVACWAGEVRVVRASARFAALVRVDVTWRDPLTDVVPWPLAERIPAQSGAPSVAALPLVGLDLPDVPEPEEQPLTHGRR